MENEKDIGLVLSGGGAKGAFQAGVWKAMCELGLAERVRVVSGTSIGAINGAAFATRRDPGVLCGFWQRHAGEIASPNLRALGPDAFLRGVRNVLAGKAFPFHGLMDRSVLERLLGTVLPESWPGDAPDVIATALECKGGILSELDSAGYNLRRFRVDWTETARRRARMLLASAAIPWGFDAVEIDGHRYVDGGWDHAGGDNIPVEPVVAGGYPELQTVIVVRCNSAEVEPEPLRVRIPSGVRVVEVRPSKTLSGIFDGVLELLAALPATDALTRKLRILSGSLAFDNQCADRSIRQGYMDGLAALRPLRSRARLEW